MKILTRIQTNSIENVMQIVSEAATAYKEQFKEVEFDEQPGLLFVIDSLGALYSNDEIGRYNDGELSMTIGM